MSKFLAPIHQWLFNKIQIMESIEKAIIQTEFSEEEKESVMNDLAQKAGEYLPDAPLADIIDQDNIHGWLQEKINIVETRHSFLVKGLITENPDSLSHIKKVYSNFGKQMGTKASAEKPQDSEKLFQLLNNYILEGMPCDRVNVVTDKSDTNLEWRTERCVHKDNWVRGGADVEVYYDLRASFTKEFIKAANPSFEYNFNLKDLVQQHSITKL